MASGILKPVPVSDPEHVAEVIVIPAREIDNSRFVILQTAVKGFLLTILFPIIFCISMGIITSNDGKET